MGYTYTASTQSHLASRSVSFRVYANDMHVGSIVETEGKGWRFHPLFQASPSRRHWPTASAALKGRLPKQAYQAVRELERMQLVAAIDAKRLAAAAERLAAKAYQAELDCQTFVPGRSFGDQ